MKEDLNIFKHILAEITFKFFMFLAICMTSLVPLVFRSIAELSGSSNLTVAAAWNTMDTVSSRICRSLAERPRPSSEQSPDKGIIFFKLCGRSRFTRSNNCGNSNKVYYVLITKRVIQHVIYEVFRAVTRKDAVFWDINLCGSRKNQRFGGTYHLHHQSDKNRRARKKISSNYQMNHAAYLGR
jgi:hypothetical protein